MATQRNVGGGGSRYATGSRRRQSGIASEPETQEGMQSAGEGPDVLLDVPQLTVEEIALEVDNLRARIAVEARLANLVELRVGAHVEIERVALEIKGVEAQAHLKARLDNVLAIIERALDTVDKNPEILTELARSVEGAAGELGEGVAQVGEEAGQLVEGAAGAAGSSSRRSGRRSRSNGGGSDSGSQRRKAGSSRS